MFWICPLQNQYARVNSLNFNFATNLSYAVEVLQSFVVDLHDKMTGLSLYGVVTDIVHERNTARTTFSLKLKDITGTIWIKLYFVGLW